MASATYQIERVVTPEYDQNTYVLHRPDHPEAIIFDPGYNQDGLSRILHEQSLRPVAIVNTHGHLDHIAGNAELKRKYSELPIWIGVNDAGMLTDPAANLSLYLGRPIISPPADRTIVDGQVFILAGFRFEAREVPGHSPGSIVLVAADEDLPFAISGDVVFRDSIGRTDFPGGSHERLLEGIRSRVLVLPDHLVLHPGHGSPTTVGRERRLNPFLAEGPPLQ